MYIYLVRHLEYQNPDNIYPFHLPLNLSVKGRNDADKIANWFVNRTLLGIHIYTSPIVRCIQTANIIAEKTNSSVVSDQRLIESSCSNLQGKKWIIPHPWRAEEDDATRETRESTRNRMVGIYDEKVSQDKDCIFVSHGEPLTVLYYYLQGKELPKYLWNPAIGQQVIEKGDVVIVKVENREVASIDKIRLI
ncbi:MAG: histidine phosphatase family protein [Patescibacteria group bacterium]